MADTPAQLRTRASSINRALDEIGDKWCLLVFQEVFWGINSFNDMLAATGVSRDLNPAISVNALLLGRVADNATEAEQQHGVDGNLGDGKVDLHEHPLRPWAQGVQRTK